MRVALSYPGCHRPCGVERVAFECARYVATMQHKVTVFAGNWEADREAFARLSLRQLGLGLVLVGDGPSFAGLAASRFGRAKVAWTIGAAHVFMLPSRVEPMGIVVLEALCGERPVVVTPQGEAGERVQYQREELLANPLDSAQIAAAIARRLDDRDLVRRLAVAGRERVSGYDWSAIVNGYRNIYRSVA
jgi:glycosyltransferase involved in cell wall biosynthesis